MTPEVKPEIDIRDYRVFPSMESARLGKKDILITYFVGAEGPFTATIPHEEIVDKPESVQVEAIRKRVGVEQAERLRFIGKKISL